MRVDLDQDLHLTEGWKWLYVIYTMHTTSEQQPVNQPLDPKQSFRIWSLDPTINNQQNCLSATSLLQPVSFYSPLANWQKLQFDRKVS